MRWAIWLCFGVAAGAQGPETELFEKQVRPVLVSKCQGCHGASLEHGGLRLDSRAAMLKGGARGPALRPGDVDGSLLVRAVRHEGLKMPLGGKLAEGEIAAIEAWVRGGAVWPGDGQVVAVKGVVERAREFWAFQPVVRRAGTVDGFVLEGLRKAGLTPAARADRATLIRRVTFDLTGLPPRPEEVAAFVNGGSYEKLVDRLLASPRFGEQWARHWMDLVRYAESHGSQGDFELPYAWRYRDYLIRALNADVPYDQLVREHLAGDLLARPRVDLVSKLNESAIGPAHLRMVEYGYVPVDALDDQFKVVDNQIDVISKAFQGLTVSCARCHDHKFDPVTQKDFYGLYGVLVNARPGMRVVDEASSLEVKRAELAELRVRLKEALGKAWLAAKVELKGPLPAAEPVRAEEYRRVWNLADAGDYAKWFRTGNGLGAGPSKAGEFYVLTEGERVVNGIYPAGAYPHLISRKHAAVLQSPRFKIDSDSISLRVLGGNLAWARVVVENYALGNGGIFPATMLNDDRMKWVRFDTKYRRGSWAYIELAQYEDRSRGQGGGPTDGRSHFGVADVVFHDSDKAPKDESPFAILLEGGARGWEAVLRECVQAWLAGTLTDRQAAYLDYFVRNDLLPNSRKEFGALVDKYRALEAEIPVPRRAPGVTVGTEFDQPLFVRGNHMAPGATVERRYLEALGGRRCGGRLELAEAIADKENPLTARVMVNRVWHHLFGRGIVRTVDNFGRNGERPTHPELLDYLAGRFMDEGWSVKKLVRLLVTSESYQRSSEASAEAERVDAANVWLQHARVRRMTAETIRDAVLAVSGELDATMYGPGIPVYYTGKTDGGGKVGPLDGARRRSVYQQVRRNSQNPFLEVFDAPKPTSTRGQRDGTNVPAQALAMLNDPFVIDQAEKWAGRVINDGGLSVRDRVERMLVWALGRRATTEEIAAGVDYLRGIEPDETALLGSRKAWADLAHSIFNFKEFLYVR